MFVRKDIAAKFSKDTPVILRYHRDKFHDSRQEILNDGKKIQNNNKLYSRPIVYILWGGYIAYGYFYTVWRVTI